MPLPQISCSASLRHAQISSLFASLSKQAQLSEAGQPESALQVLVQIPPLASTRTHSPEAQSSVRRHA